MSGFIQQCSPDFGSYPPPFSLGAFNTAPVMYGGKVLAPVPFNSERIPRSRAPPKEHWWPLTMNGFPTVPPTWTNQMQMPASMTAGYQIPTSTTLTMGHQPVSTTDKRPTPNPPTKKRVQVPASRMIEGRMVPLDPMSDERRMALRSGLVMLPPPPMMKEGDNILVNGECMAGWCPRHVSHWIKRTKDDRFVVFVPESEKDQVTDNAAEECGAWSFPFSRVGPRPLRGPIRPKSSAKVVIDLTEDASPSGQVGNTPAIPHMGSTMTQHSRKSSASSLSQASSSGASNSRASTAATSVSPGLTTQSAAPQKPTGPERPPTSGRKRRRDAADEGSSSPNKRAKSPPVREGKKKRKNWQLQGVEAWQKPAVNRRIMGEIGGSSKVDRWKKAADTLAAELRREFSAGQGAGKGQSHDPIAIHEDDNDMLDADLAAYLDIPSGDEKGEDDDDGALEAEFDACLGDETDDTPSGARGKRGNAQGGSGKEDSPESANDQALEADLAYFFRESNGGEPNSADAIPDDDTGSLDGIFEDDCPEAPYETPNQPETPFPKFRDMYQPKDGSDIFTLEF